MKIVTKVFLTLCLVAGLGATLTASAQIRSDATIRVDIPYAFVVHNTTLPSGTYVVTVADPGSPDLNVLEIRSVNGKTAVLFETETLNLTQAMKQTELQFDRVGDTYFLARVFLQGDESGNQALKSKRQQRLEASGSTTENHSIGASLVHAKPSRQTARKLN